MSYSGDAAEQVVRMTLEGAVVAAKITGEEFLQRINPEGEELDPESPYHTPAEDILLTPWE